MLETIITLFVYLGIITVIVLPIGIISYIAVCHGPRLLNFITKTIKWNMNKFKDDYDYKD